MRAFERIQSGIASIDKILDNIRLGDNVVMQVTHLDDFRRMAQAFVKQAILEKRKINYIRFANHKPILEPQDGLMVHKLDAGKGFESFTVKVHEIVEKEGYEAYYVFDCLSDLQVVWSTDLMMGNFFCVTCPYLFELNTVAYFPVLREHHDYKTIARIQETTQLLLNIYSNETETYLHPIKVWNRYSSDMYLPYRLNDQGEFESLENGVELADYYRLINEEQKNSSEQNIDSYERFINKAKASFHDGDITGPTLAKLTLSMMTHDKKMADLIKREFTPEDLFFIKERIIGTGIIGGKACGMLLARKIVENHLPQYSSYMEPHDSYYIGTDVFYSFLVENNLWMLRIQGRKQEEYFSKGAALATEILKGHFPESIRARFKRMLEYFGQIPIIVRSSSFLEDGFGSAFAGKYESVFCANSGDSDERLESFENAVRQVYASTVDPSALEYRRKRGMAEADEQMAILVQRVSGTRFKDIYMPCAAGVGFSYSVYRWSEDLQADAGLLRLVAGLGTKAVERTGEDYPRLVNLDKPERSALNNEEERHRFSQRKLDTINIKANTFEEVHFSRLIPSLPDWYTDIICEHDHAAESILRQRGEYSPVRFISCKGIVQNEEFMALMRDVLATLQKHYGTPVDIEYTINFTPEGEFLVNLLQCRPLYVWQTAEQKPIPAIEEDKVLLKVYHSFMGKRVNLNVDVVVWIDSQGYADYPYNSKNIVAGIVGEINQHYKDTGKTLMLVSPGRLGTSSPDLGVSVVFSDISNFSVLCEYEDEEIGFTPELSYGSHFFQDLVEAEMFYIASMNYKGNEKAFFDKNFLSGKESVLSRILPTKENPFNIVRVYEVDQENPLELYADLQKGIVICGYFK